MALNRVPSMTVVGSITSQELWQKYEESRADSQIIIKFHDLVPFFTDQQFQVPVSHFLLRLFDRWVNVDDEMSAWFLTVVDQADYTAFLLTLARNSIKSLEDVVAFKRLKLNLIKYLLTDHHDIVTDILLKISMHDSAYMMSEVVNQLTLSSNTHKIRCFELIIQVACISNDHLTKVLDSTLVKSWINEFKSRDVLVALNVIEMAAALVQTNNGLNFLEKTTVLKELNSILNGNLESIDDYLKVCAVIKFWSSLVLCKNVELDLLLGKFKVLDRMLEFLKIKGREEILIHTLTMIGNLGSHKAGLEMIVKHDSILDTFATFYKEASNHMKLASMEALSCFIDREVPDADDSQLCEKVYAYFPSCIHDVQHYWKSPFDEMRYNAYAVLKGIASHSWGVSVIANHEIFVMLLDRSTDSTLNGKVI